MSRCRAATEYGIPVRAAWARMAGLRARSGTGLRRCDLPVITVLRQGSTRPANGSTGACRAARHDAESKPLGHYRAPAWTTRRARAGVLPVPMLAGNHRPRYTVEVAERLHERGE